MAAPSVAQEVVPQALTQKIEGVVVRTAPTPSQRSVRIHTTSLNPRRTQTIWVINGIAWRGDAAVPLLQALEPDDIINIALYRDGRAERCYGATAGNRVVEITTRNAPPRPGDGTED